MRKLLLELYVLTICAVIYNIVRTPRMLRKVLIAWALGTAITAVASILGIVLFYSGVHNEMNPLVRGFGSLPPGNYARLSGLFLNVNMACNYLSIGLLIVLAIRRIRSPAIISSHPTGCSAGKLRLARFESILYSAKERGCRSSARRTCDRTAELNIYWTPTIST